MVVDDVYKHELSLIATTDCATHTRVYKHELSVVATMDCATHTRYVGDSQVSNAQCMLCAFISTNHTAVNGADVSRLCV